MRAPTLRLGHITYSNCFPVHARLLDRPEPDDPLLVEGMPSRLNDLLAHGELDVAPCSSIEYARHAERYRILPDLVIGSRGVVRSILFLSPRLPEELRGPTIALPTASATSVVLLKILLRLRWEVEANFVWFDQAREDPFAAGAHAALFIGDVALRPDLYPSLPVRVDLGQAWWDYTGLPFAFALWQAGSNSVGPLARLHAQLLESRQYFRARRAELAERYAAGFGFAAPELEAYWADLTFELDPSMLEGLEWYYRLAAEVGEIPQAPRLRWIE